MTQTKSYGRPLLWMSPMILMLILFYLYPLLDVVRLSFTNASTLTPEFRYTLNSYIKTFKDSNFLNTVYVSVIFVFMNIVVQIPLGLMIAVALNAGIHRKLRGTIFVRTVVLAAWMAPGVLVGIVWQMLLSSSQFGIVNYFLETIGIGRIEFLVQPDYALISIIVANIWRGTAFTMILQYAGLQRIPLGLYEAADIDGASAFQKFYYITIPQLVPILFINFVLITIYTFNTFDMVIVLTGGGPARATQVLTLSAYEQVFSFFSLGRGSAIAVILLAFNLVMAVAYYKLVLSQDDRK
ncbi:MAG: sugar ABC transporter permease [Treponemataceae bacterium]